jgi:phosphoribosylformylglycinamidine synthase
MRAQIRVSPKQGVLDPQGSAIARALGALGFSGIREVRQGKLIEIELEATDPAEACARIEAMCIQLLSNPVMEDYAIEFSDWETRR